MDPNGAGSATLPIQLFHGDCIEVMKTLPDKSIDIGIFDLPYGILNNNWDVLIDLNEMWIQLKRLRQNERTPFFFFCNARLGAELIRTNPKWFKKDFIWVKASKDSIENIYTTNFANSKLWPMTGHELIYVFCEKTPIYNRDKYHKCTETYRTKRIRKSDYIISKEIDWYHREYSPKLPNTVLFFKKKKDKHTSAKPIDLIEWLLKYFSNEGDTVLDITMGGGSTGVACKNTNRRFIGIEKDQKWYDYSKSRLMMGMDLDAEDAEDEQEEA
jgi:site-specific DNA-methyltransferase (adenine-specific)